MEAALVLPRPRVKRLAELVAELHAAGFISRRIAVGDIVPDHIQPLAVGLDARDAAE
jgi:hypothetical protein